MTDWFDKCRICGKWVSIVYSENNEDCCSYEYYLKYKKGEKKNEV